MTFRKLADTGLAAAALVALAAVSGCIPEDGPLMEPGKDCMECHAGGDAPTWTVAGTVRAGRGAAVRITDQNGWSITLRANRAGNFYTAEAVRLPLRAISVDGDAMGSTELADAARTRHPGSCNQGGCHSGGDNF